MDRALSVPYEPALYDASDLPRVLAELGEHGLVMASLGDPAYLAADLMSFEDYLLWVVQDTEHFARTVEIVAERVKENLRRQLQVCTVDLYRICGPEYMTPPFLPPAMFQRIELPLSSPMFQPTFDSHGAAGAFRPISPCCSYRAVPGGSPIDIFFRYELPSVMIGERRSSMRIRLRPLLPEVQFHFLII